MFPGQAGEIGLPGGRQGEDGTSFFHGHRRGEAVRGGELGERGDGGRGRRHGVQLPLDALRCPGLEQRHPRFFFPSLYGHQVEIIRNVGAAEDLPCARRRLVQRQERDQATGPVLDAMDFESALLREDVRPLALPRPGEKRRAQPGGGDEPVPHRGPHRLQTVVDLDFHRPADRLTDRRMRQRDRGIRPPPLRRPRPPPSLRPWRTRSRRRDRPRTPGPSSS